ncbi:FAD-binding protein [Breznakiella homolactica]|uniref:FAD-binding protein n=1 Tax=Breznakiella homolactica TaxID=2798577 RepID=A0A7T7XL85_9SPIR|nr:FAD-binding protein [Breznakiella homolactica]QQO08431.1 FAD-binding protein [Breznakiella homolactica]
METLFCDVLVVGGGSAGARAVAAAQEYPVTVVLAMKGRIGSSGASTFRVTEAAGYGAADGRRVAADSPKVHFEDIMTASRGMCIPEVAKTLAEKAPETIGELESFGVHFEREDGTYLITQGCFGSIPRNYNLKGHGTQLVESLARHFKKESLTICEDCMITELLVADNRCCGAAGVFGDGRKITIHAKSVVLTSGGAGGLFKYSLNPGDVTGDSYALGFRAGAELMNMEFMQVGCGILHPGFSILNSWIWSLHPDAYDAGHRDIFSGQLPEGVTKEAVMDAKASHYPFSSESLSKYVEVSIQKAIAEGHQGKHGGVYLDVREAMARSKGRKGFQLFEDMWKLTNEWYLSRGIDVMAGPIEIADFAHAINGGVRINPRAESTVSGLYAAGEAASGPHGADRLGGNMLVTCMVFGKIAGTNAAENALEKNGTDPVTDSLSDGIFKQQETLTNGSGGRPWNTMKEELQETMWKNMMVLRTEKGLTECLECIGKLSGEGLSEKSAGDNPFAPFEYRNMLLAARIMAESALERRESRGSHYREDYPAENREYAKPRIVSKQSSDFSGGTP